MVSKLSETYSSKIYYLLALSYVSYTRSTSICVYCLAHNWPKKLVNPWDYIGC